jgi:polysaccharide biosynthesis/export protein
MNASISTARKSTIKSGGRSRARRRALLPPTILAVLLVVPSGAIRAQQPSPENTQESTAGENRRIEQLRQMIEKNAGPGEARVGEEYRVGAEDLLEISVFEAPEMNRTLRVSASGEITLPLVGPVRAAGLTTRALESVIEELLRRTYVNDPHVGVFVREMQSHAVSVFGAVKKPGVYQIREEKTLVEVLALAEGLAEDAGDTVLVERSGTSGDGTKSETVEVHLKSLLSSAAPGANVRVRPGDTVTVTRAGIVYVVGEVKRPGGFVLRTNENISVLQALALAEGLTRTSAKNQARIIRTNADTGERQELPIHLGLMLAGRAPDPLLLPRDIVFVPNSATKSALLRGLEAGLSTVTGLAIYRF